MAQGKGLCFIEAINICKVIDCFISSTVLQLYVSRSVALPLLLCSTWCFFILSLFSFITFSSCLWQLTLIASSALYSLYASCFLRQEIRSLLGWAGQSNSPATCSARAFGFPLGVIAQVHVAAPLWEMERWNKPVNENVWTVVKSKFLKSVHSQLTLLSLILCCFGNG